jgi:hypothetical protein
MQRDALPPEAILYAMVQTADTVNEAYGRALQRKDTKSIFLAESELPASKDKIKAALVFRAFFYKSQGKLDKPMYERMYSSHQTCYGYLANIVSEEVAARSRKEAELMGDIPEIQRKGQFDPKWFEEFEKYSTPPEEIGRYGEQFLTLCGEFARRLEALDDPSKKAKELAVLRQALLSD